MPDLTFQDLSTVQSNVQQKPVTFAAAATISPVTALNFVTGTTNIATLVPPVTGYHELKLMFTDASPGDLLTTGNVDGLTTISQNSIILMIYNPITRGYYARAL